MTIYNEYSLPTDRHETKRSHSAYHTIRLIAFRMMQNVKIKRQLENATKM